MTNENVLDLSVLASVSGGGPVVFFGPRVSKADPNDKTGRELGKALLYAGVSGLSAAPGGPAAALVAAGVTFAGTLAVDALLNHWGDV